VLYLTTTDAPGMQLCTALIDGQEAGATGLVPGSALDCSSSREDTDTNTSTNHHQLDL